MTDLVDRLKQWSETPYEGDPMIDVLLDDVSAALKEITTLRAELAEQTRLNGMGSEREADKDAHPSEARRALSIIADMATRSTGHEGNLLRQIADVARKAMEGGR